VSLPDVSAGVYLMEWVGTDGVVLQRQKLYRLP